MFCELWLSLEQTSITVLTVWQIGARKGTDGREPTFQVETNCTNKLTQREKEGNK